jgi:hypothetical protein
LDYLHKWRGYELVRRCTPDNCQARSGLCQDLLKRRPQELKLSNKQRSLDCPELRASWNSNHRIDAIHDSDESVCAQKHRALIQIGDVQIEIRGLIGRIEHLKLCIDDANEGLDFEGLGETAGIRGGIVRKIRWSTSAATLGYI